MIYMTDHNSIMRPALNTRDTIIHDSFTTSAEMRSNCCYTAIVHNKLFAKHVGGFFASFTICCLFFSENLKFSLCCIYLTIRMILFISPHLMGLQHKITPYPLKVREKFHTFKIKNTFFFWKVYHRWIQEMSVKPTLCMWCGRNVALQGFYLPISQY